MNIATVYISQLGAIFLNGGNNILDASLASANLCSYA
jgi:hypothetical protein